MKTYDCVIIGAGPSGCSAAIPLIKAGLSVLLIDMNSFPREKTCGDGLANDSVEFLKKVGIWEETEKESNFCPQVEIFSSQGSSFRLESPVYTIRREIFDEVMFKNVLSQGAEFLDAEFTGSISKNGKSMTLDVSRGGKLEKIYSSYVIIATGCKSIKQLRKCVSGCTNSDMIAIRGYYESELGLNNTQVYFSKRFKSGYFWIFPMGNRSFNIGCGCKTSETGKINLKNELESFIDDRFVSTKGNWITPPKAALLRTNLSNFGKNLPENTLLVGDALGTTQPFSGEGIGKALQSGYLAGEVILDNYEGNKTHVSDTFNQKFSEQFFTKYRPYQIADKYLNSGVSGRILFSLISRSSRLQKVTADLLNEDRDPDQVFRFKGLLSLLYSKKCGKPS